MWLMVTETDSLAQAGCPMSQQAASVRIEADVCVERVVLLCVTDR